MSAIRPNRRRQAMPAGAGRLDIVAQLGDDYRLWARLPADVQVLVALASPVTRDPILASVPRPVFPRGVCTGCGCSEFDACLGEFGEGCAWVDPKSRDRCTSCGPAPRPASMGPRTRRRR